MDWVIYHMNQVIHHVNQVISHGSGDDPLHGSDDPPHRSEGNPPHGSDDAPHRSEGDPPHGSVFPRDAASPSLWHLHGSPEVRPGRPSQPQHQQSLTNMFPIFKRKLNSCFFSLY